MLVKGAPDLWDIITINLEKSRLHIHDEIYINIAGKHTDYYHNVYIDTYSSSLASDFVPADEKNMVDRTQIILIIACMNCYAQITYI